MSITKTLSKIKTVLTFATFTYAMVQALIGWTLLIKDSIIALKEARARRKK